MKSWQEFSLREKQMVSIAAIFVFLFFLYVLIWLPLNSHVNHLRFELKKEKKLLVFMEETAQRLTSLEKNFQNKKIVESNVSILSLLQHQLNQSSFVSNLKELHQTSHDSVQFSFDNVEFDAFIQWLTMLSEEHGLVMKRLSIQASSSPGLVGVEGEASG